MKLLKIIINISTLYYITYGKAGNWTNRECNGQSLSCDGNFYKKTGYRFKKGTNDLTGGENVTGMENCMTT